MHTTRREFLRAVAAGSVALGAGWTQNSPIDAAERTALNAVRKQAAHRRRRIIYNNDGDDIWAKGADTTEKFLALRHEPLLGTQVDSIYYCTTQSFNLFTHATRVAEVFLSREGTFANNNLPTFLEQQNDGLRMSCEFARKHSLESIWTLRMNHIHDAWTPQFVSQWKKDDPRRVMAALADVSSLNDRRRLWSLVDFEHPDVEPRIVAIIEEVLRNCDPTHRRGTQGAIRDTCQDRVAAGFCRPDRCGSPVRVAELAPARPARHFRGGWRSATLSLQRPSRQVTNGIERNSCRRNLEQGQTGRRGVVDSSNRVAAKRSPP